jgi:hypothetical protein
MFHMKVGRIVRSIPVTCPVDPEIVLQKAAALIL